MRRPIAALLLGALAACALALEGVPGIRVFFLSWLGANALPKSPETVAAVELPQDGISAMDAALVLRAVLRYEPRAVAFLVPIQLDGKESLLAAKLAETKIPVSFTSNDRPAILPDVTAASSLPPLPRLAAYVPRPHPAGAFLAAPPGKALIVARQGARAVASNVLCLVMGSQKISGSAPGSVRIGSLSIPVNAAGSTDINPLARDYVGRLSFGQLMLETERSESGSISAALDSRFRGRLVAVQPAGGRAADGGVAILDHLTGRPAPFGVAIILVLIAASLPWWSGKRRTRALLGFMAGCGWALLAVAIYQEFQVTMPLLPAVLLPALALISRGPGNVGRA